MELAQVEEVMRSLYLGQGGLRDEDRKKAREVAALLDEIDRVVGKRDRLIVEAAAGHAYVSFVGAKLYGYRRLWLIEREAGRVERCRSVAAGLPETTVEVRAGEISDRALWPAEADVVVALHACGSAADQVIAAAAAARARRIFLVPCCYARDLPAALRAEARAESLGLPRQAEVRRRFIDALVDAERVLALEAAGYSVELVPFVPRSVTPHNLLYRARHMGEPVRMAEARARLEALW
jgi:hypothetical protein